MKLKQLKGENAFKRNAAALFFWRRETRALCVRAHLCACLCVTLGGQRLHQTGDTHTRRGDIIEQRFSGFDSPPPSSIIPLSLSSSFCAQTSGC